MASLNH